MLGITGEQEAALKARRRLLAGPDGIEIWPQNLKPWSLFRRVATQWRTAGPAGQPIGLDYTALAFVARVERCRVTPDLLDDIQAMEAAALDVWRARRR
ncbi:DUF1799 domain-containing protein [Tistrella mobilis]